MGSTSIELRLLVERAERLLKKKGRAISHQVMADVKLVSQMIIAYLDGSYRQLPWATIAALGAALFYFVNPFDLVFDAVPLAGYVDDAAVLSFTLRALRYDIAQFQSRLGKGEREAKLAQNREPLAVTDIPSGGITSDSQQTADE